MEYDSINKRFLYTLRINIQIQKRKIDITNYIFTCEDKVRITHDSLY